MYRRPLYFFASSTTRILVARSLCKILRELLVLDDTQLRQINGSTTHFWPTSLTSNKMGPLFCSSIFFLQAQSFEKPSPLKEEFLSCTALHQPRT